MPTRPPRLIVRDASGNDRELEIARTPFTLGRQGDNELVLFDNRISRRHARIWREGESFMVEDLGSVNGTVVNDLIRLEPRQPRVLDSGDRIRMGETTLHFLVG